MAGIINRRDLEFQLFEVLDTEALTSRPRYAEHSKETFLAVLDIAETMATEKFAPHNRKADEHEPTFDGQRVTMIPEVKAALQAFCDAGFIAAAHDFERGGMQLPVVMTQAAFSLFKSANVGTAAYPFLTIGNANVIHRFGSEAQKKKYLEPLLAGRFFGTMALTEPQAGSSLSDITTTAAPNADGTFSLSGNKIFISAGDHELSENIVHLVLAKIPGGPPGVKGISLFIVPKFRVNDDGTLGPKNDVTLTGLIHKMGYRGTTSTMLAFGEKGACIGELVGEPHKGLSYMFHMMNEARIGVGMGAVMLGYRGYLASLDYARERPQGRAPTNKNPADPQLPIIEHADVRRMLLAQKTYVEGGYALCLYCARLVDETRVGAGDAAKSAATEAGLLLDLLTPIAKSWPSQWCLEANSLAIQIHGGYGYTREYPVEQFYRDNRLNPIHEGTHGIQALDLLGRKAVMNDGAAMKLFVREAQQTIAEAQRDRVLAGYAAELDAALGEIAATLQALGPVLASNPTLALANAVLFLEAFGHTVLAWIWLHQALAAQRGLQQGVGAQGADGAFYRGKLAACRWFYRWELPKTRQWHDLLRSLDDTTLTMPPECF
ncbi:MAG: acyl-CoA dehydrogenase [Sulfuritalea sp.]|jgi:butyryl-CoA dehydrogenase|nr:acyl-CoA dehydrogenase [Sulfuritalea sp.]